MLSKLNASELKILRKKFGENLDNLVKRVKWAEEENKQYISLYLKMRRLLKNPILKERKKKSVEKVVEIISIYEYFSNYTKEEIDLMISKLSEDEIKILHKKFGRDLSCLVKRVVWSKEEHKQYTALSTKMRRLLKNPNPKGREKKSINKEVKKMSLYDYFSSYSKENVDKVLSKLTYGEKYLLMLKFDADFSCYRSRANLSDEQRKKYANLILKMKRMLGKTERTLTVVSKQNLMTIYEYFKGYSKAQVDYAVSTLTSQEKFSIQSRYGADLSKAYVRPDNSSHRLMTLLYKVRRKLESLPASEQPVNCLENLKAEQLKKEMLQRTKNIWKSVEFHYIISKLPRVEALMLELRFGLYGKVYSTQEIAQLFNKTEIDIIRIIRSSLNDIKMLSKPISDEILAIMEPVSATDNKLSLVKKED